MRNTQPKARQCRREGVNLFGSPKYQKILARNPNIPGMHGGKRLGKMTEYAKQLREKQKLKRMFGLSEKQFRRCFDKATISKVVTGDKLLEILERRLDNIVFRAGLAMTRMQSRQFVSHGLLMLNGQRVTIPSIEAKEGDVLEVREKSKKSKVFAQNKEELDGTLVPDWLKVDLGKMSIEVLKIPEQKHFEQLIETRSIVEFYSR
ncbi:30S ribosomal protein S4 [Candidatus Gracilibacteria bacterium]|nr:30S ribosomal protein S4 [Candidatus Gracilibacteria bacterium]